MKVKHNKKRNTAFLYEVIIRELTKNIVTKDEKKKNSLINILKEHFSQGNILTEELKLYTTLYTTCSLKPRAAEALITEVKKRHEILDKKELFFEQSSLIKKLNKTSETIFSNFIPNYKNIATIYQMFNVEGSAKQKVLLEQTIYNRLVEKENHLEEMKPIDNLVYTSFVGRFNDKYASKLLNEQKELLSKYISSFEDNGIELKIYLNEEIGRLKEVLKSSLGIKENQEDKQMFEKTKKVLELVEEFKNQKINKNMIKGILKVQNLAKEIGS